MTSTRKTALITGAGRGLGRALALELSARGFNLAIVARTREDLLETAAAATAATPGARVLVVPADVADPAAATQIAGQTFAAYGRIDVVVHNASDLGPIPMTLLADTTADQLQRVFAVNTLGPFALTRALVGSMLLADSGVVVQISSDAAVEPYPKWGAYAASKAASDHLSRIWAAEFEDTAIRFVAVDPGEMNTKMHCDALPDADVDALADPASVARKLADLIEAPPGDTARVALDVEVAS